ncbi:MAG: hypothetical protein JO097_14835 [Acidobacteriaceae bacterium]|nr:hypothetical protein [Acidobacteriaceae bacterium]MBV9295940.1 hypothetical protein [Acidobacteriaceae bacterium]MBV9765822.1 hypothetical protein [Acidobacteriaceae bacterium]
MKKFVFGSLMAVSLCSFAAFADQLTGYVSDAHCGSAHSSPSEANSKCIDKCLKGGSDPVLVSNGKVMKFDADSKDKAAALAGKNVTVDGTVDGDVIKVNTIEEAKESK